MKVEVITDNNVWSTFNDVTDCNIMTNASPNLLHIEQGLKKTYINLETIDRFELECYDDEEYAFYKGRNN